MVKDGIVLGKRYAVLSKIGAGGMADVYKGRDQMLNRYVAIKVLKKQFDILQPFVHLRGCLFENGGSKGIVKIPVATA